MASSGSSRPRNTTSDRAVVDDGRTWTQPSNGPFAHVYLTRSLYPFAEALAGLSSLEEQIEEEWRPAVRLLQRVGRPRRAGS